MALKSCVWLACSLLVAGALPGAQTPPAAPPAAPALAQIERLEEWPAVPKELKETLALEVDRLRKARTPEMAEQGRAGLLALGALAGPELLRVLAKETEEQALERVREVLLAVTGAAHTRLLAREFENKSSRVRCFALERASTFPDSQLRAAAEAALKRARAARAKQPEDGGELFFAARCCASSGSLAGIDELYESARKEWAKRGPGLRTALEAVRSPEATALLAAHVASADRGQMIAALNLLAGCGEREATIALAKPQLDNEDNGIRIAAINALRGAVDGELPLERLPVFEAIEVAKRWKARL